MAETKTGTPREKVNSNEDSKLSHLDEDLKIMEEHADKMQDVEDSIQGSMKKRDREYKDSHFQSVPKGKKHQR